MNNQGIFYEIKCSSRPITDLKYNKDGDLIFASSKDSTATLINSNGYILGTYIGHEGSIFTLSVSADSSLLLTGGADLHIFSWDVESGKCLNQKSANCVIKGSCMIGQSENCLFISDSSLNKKQSILMYDNNSKSLTQLFTPDFMPTSILIDYSETKAVLSDTKGNVHLFDLRKNEVILSKNIHNDVINNLSNSFCKSFFVSSSNDAQVKIVDTDTLEVKKKFCCEDPVNSSAIFPSNDKIVCVGGINARDVTTSKGKDNFDSNFFDIVTCNKVGSYTTHFGTINCVDVRPDCSGYCSAGEEGLVNIVEFGEDFFNAPFTEFE